jgi:hypothetical protein
MNINIQHQDDNYYDKFVEEISPRTNYGSGFEKNLKEIATELGFKSVSLLMKAQKVIDNYNHQRYERANKKRLEKFKDLHGEYDSSKIQHRMMIADIPFEFDCKYQKDLI